MAYYKIGERLRELRKERNMSQQDVADILTISQQSIQCYEANKKEPSINTLKKLADIFDVSIEYLIGAIDIRTPISEMNPEGLSETEDRILSKLKTYPPEIKEALLLLSNRLEITDNE